jgi:hypothetical protein
MRDRFANTGAASGGESATTDADTFPPMPNSATFAIAPASDSGTAISMTATTGSDASGPVQYFFDETSGSAGGTDSSWQTSPVYVDSGLTEGLTYTYTVTMRDALLNVGTASDPESAIPAVVTYSITTSTTAPTANVVAADSETGPANNATSMRYSTTTDSENTDRGQKFTPTTSYTLDKITIQTRDVVLAGAKGAGMSVELWNVDTSTLLNVSTGASTPADLAVNDYITYDVTDTALTAGTQYCFVLRFDSTAADREMDVARVGNEYAGGTVVKRMFGTNGTRPADGSLSVPSNDNDRDLVFYIQEL